MAIGCLHENFQKITFCKNFKKSKEKDIQDIILLAWHFQYALPGLDNYIFHQLKKRNSTEKLFSDIEKRFKDVNPVIKGLNDTKYHLHFHCWFMTYPGRGK